MSECQGFSMCRWSYCGACKDIDRGGGGCLTSHSVDTFCVRVDFIGSVCYSHGHSVAIRWVGGCG